MTTISALNGASYASAPPPYAASPVAANKSATAPQSSTIVSVGTAATPSQTYYFPSTPAASAPPIWQHPPGDAISALMANNYLQPALSDRFNGMGSALLNFFKGDGSSGNGNYAQSVLQGLPVSSSDKPGETAAQSARPALPVSSTAAGEKLTIKTQSGAQVEISLESLGNSLTVDVKSSGELSDAEREAIAKLSGAFQDALDGLAAKTPHLDLAGLTQFDSTVLSSVDLHSEVTPQGQAVQSIDFHADSQARTIAMNGPAGALKVNVDMRNAASWGNSKQRAAATANYLKQFDAEAARGKGDESLVAMFKDAFTQMNSDYVQPPNQRPAAPLSDSDHAMLTGLADFNASVTQTAKASNPMHLNELDTFSYQVSQNTSVRGGLLDRSISQNQQSHLSASYHAGLVPDVPLQLSTDRNSQNYYFKQIDDSADSTMNVAYFKGGLAKALLQQSASQSMHTSKYEVDKLVEDTTTPLRKSQTTDILAALKPFLKNGKLDSDADRFQWQEALSKAHDSILLQSDPLGLHGDGT